MGNSRPREPHFAVAKMSTLDRYIIKSFAINYLISLAVLICMYLVLDLFFNFDEFTQDGEVALVHALLAACRYYAAHVFLYFVQISGVITLFAMCFTLARMQSNSEFVAIVASGVSLYRVAFTVIVTGMVLNGLWLIDQEWIIPRLAPALSQKHAATVGDAGYGVWFIPQPDGSLLSASEFDPNAQVLRGLVLMRASREDGEFELITADKATWQAGGSGVGMWMLERGTLLQRVRDLDGTVSIESQPVQELSGALAPQEVALRRAANWVQFMNRGQLARIREQGMAPAQQLARTLHNRFATPIVNMLILVIGIPFFLNRQPASVVESGGKCLLACGACFLMSFFCQNVAWDLNPFLTAWLPLFVLAPYMVVTLDNMKT